MGTTIRVDTIRKLVTIARGGKIGNPRLKQLTDFLVAHPGMAGRGGAAVVR